MRRDQAPGRSCRSGSGWPRPWNGSRWAAWTSLTILSAILRSWAIHQARSSKAAESNTKLLTDNLEGDALVASEGGEQAFSHGLTLQQVGRLLLGDDLPPEVDGQDHARRLAL